MTAIAPWSRSILDYMGVATHIHTRFPANPTCQGEQTVEEVFGVAQALGLQGVAFTQHTTDPAKPVLAPLGLYVDLQWHDDDVFALSGVKEGLEGWSGIEANIMPDGSLDVEDGSFCYDAVPYVVASQHGGLGGEEKDPKAIERRLVAACKNVYVTTLGHPSRYNDHVAVEWGRIFEAAYSTATAVELNFNLWYGKGPGRDRTSVNNDAWYDAQKTFWRSWLGKLANSGADVAIGLDIHNLGMWPGVAPAESWTPPTDALVEFIKLISDCGIPAERVINRSAASFERWLETPKSRRRLIPRLTA